MYLRRSVARPCYGPDGACGSCQYGSVSRENSGLGSENSHCSDFALLKRDDTELAIVGYCKCLPADGTGAVKPVVVKLVVKVLGVSLYRAMAPSFSPLIFRFERVVITTAIIDMAGEEGHSGHRS